MDSDTETIDNYKPKKHSKKKEDEGKMDRLALEALENQLCLPAENEGPIIEKEKYSDDEESEEDNIREQMDEIYGKISDKTTNERTKKKLKEDASELLATILERLDNLIPIVR